MINQTEYQEQREACKRGLQIRQSNIIPASTTTGCLPIDSIQLLNSLQQSSKIFYSGQLSFYSQNLINGNLIKQVNSHQWPYSCIGLIISQNQQNNIIGMGTLISKNMILTSASNVYNRKLKKQTKDLVFIPGIHKNLYSEKYAARKIFYPKQYIDEENYEQYNIAIIQLSEDLMKKYGYLGLALDYKKINQTNIYAYGYIQDILLPRDSLYLYYSNQTFQLFGRNIIFPNLKIPIHQSGSPLIIQEEGQHFRIIGIYNGKNGGVYLNNQMRQIMNKWVKIPETLLFLRRNNTGANICKYIKDEQWNNLITLYLQKNNIGSQGCRFLKDFHSESLTSLNLRNNQIGNEGCKFLKDSNWPKLNGINLNYNQITSEGCKYLKYSKWLNLKILYLQDNNIGIEGCKQLIVNNWKNLVELYLYNNNITSQGCKFIKQFNFPYLILLELQNNKIGDLGCKYLPQLWCPYLNKLYLRNNQISDNGCIYLKNMSSQYLKEIRLVSNNVSDHTKIILLKMNN